MRSILRFFILISCMAVLAFPEPRSEKGPFCWAGLDGDGKDKFVPCKPEHWRIINVNLGDEGAFDAVKIHTQDGCITVSRERFLKALADWAAENRAKP